MMDELRELFALTADLAAEFHETLPERRVFPDATVDELRAALGGPLPETPRDAKLVVRELAAAADPGLVASPGGRYYGFVIGGTVPSSLAADWLVTAWDQKRGPLHLQPGGLGRRRGRRRLAARAARTPARRVIRLRHGRPGGELHRARRRPPPRARTDRLGRRGARPERRPARARRGRREAPRTIDRALRMLGLGAPTDVVPADDQGRLLVDQLELTDEPTILCAQAGDVSTGAFDDFHALADRRDAAANTWLHVDGAFGLWAAASPRCNTRSQASSAPTRGRPTRTSG
jgi:Glutamate decarboxylase and related PLP-dependent proteins